MSENYNPQGGTPNPYGPPNSHGDSNAYGTTPPPETSPYQNPNGYPPAQNWDFNQSSEANKKSTLALVLGIVSFFFLGVILSIPGYFIAKQAEAMNGENAKAAKIVNLISIGVSILGVVFFIFMFTLGAIGSAAGVR
jgi:hypothetical protein